VVVLDSEKDFSSLLVAPSRGHGAVTSTLMPNVAAASGWRPAVALSPAVVVLARLLPVQPDGTSQRARNAEPVRAGADRRGGRVGGLL